MSDTTYKYYGYTIAKNAIGYRVCFISYTPIFRTLKEAKEYVAEELES